MVEPMVLQLIHLTAFFNEFTKLFKVAMKFSWLSEILISVIDSFESMPSKYMDFIIQVRRLRMHPLKFA